MWNWKGYTTFWTAVLLAVIVAIVGLVYFIQDVAIDANRTRCDNYSERIEDREVRWQYNSFWSQECLVRLSTGRWVTLDYYLTYFPVDLTGDVQAEPVR